MSRNIRAEAPALGRMNFWVSGTLALAFLVGTPLAASAYPYPRTTFPAQEILPNVCGWHLMKSPNKTASGSAYQNQLNAVVANSSTDAWAGGFYVSPTAAHALLQHFDGTKWTNVTAPRSGGINDQIFGMGSTSSTDVWGVGWFLNTSANQYQTLVYHYNGSAWSVVPSPNAGIFSVLRAIAADSPTDAWAVGQSQLSTGQTVPLVEHWNGSSWSIVGSYSLNEPYSTIIGVFPSSSTKLETLGDFSPDQNPGFLDPQAAAYNNGVWTLQATPPMGNASTSDNVLAPVSATDMWAIGDWFDGTNFQTYAQHFDGTSWTTVTTPDPGGSPGSGLDTALFGGAAVNHRDVFGVGTYWDGMEWQTYTMRFNGTSWASVASPNSGGTDAVYNFLNAAAKIPGTTQVWAVGYHGVTFNSTPPTKTLVMMFHC